MKYFNTGRLYAEEGQAIAYRIEKTVTKSGCLEISYVRFYDYSRGINKAVCILHHKEDTDQEIQKAIMKAYDKSDYLNWDIVKTFKQSDPDFRQEATKLIRLNI